MDSQHTRERGLSIIVPAWNEKETILFVIKEILKVEFLKDANLIVVDDGSNDGTGKIVDETSETNDRITVLHRKHQGKDMALWAGIKTADTEWIGVMDADGQNDPLDFEPLYAKAMLEKDDAVWGIRVDRKDKWTRLLSSSITIALKAFLLGALAVKDPGCGIFIARRRFLDEIASACPAPSGQLHCHLPELIEWLGGRVTELQVRHRKRRGGRAKFGISNRICPGIASVMQAFRLRSITHGEG